MRSLCLAAAWCVLLGPPRPALARWLTAMPPAATVLAVPKSVEIADFEQRLRALSVQVLEAEMRLGRSPFDGRLRRSVGALYLRKARWSEDTSDYRAAEKHFRAAVGIDAGDWRARLGLARALAGLARFGEALVQAREAAAQAGQSLAAVELLGDLHFASGDLLEADALYRRLHEGDARLGSLARMALVAEARGRDERTAALLAQACAVAARASEAASARAWCARARGEFALSRGRLEQAERHFSRALSFDPSDPDARWGGARAALRSGDLERARRTLAGLVKRRPRPRYLATLALVVDEQGEHERAADEREKARRLLAAAVEAGDRSRLDAYANALADAARSTEALRLARRQVDAVRHDAAAYVTLARCLAGVDRLEEAVSAADRSLVSGSREPELAARAALVYLAAARLDRAASHLQASTIPGSALPVDLARRVEKARQAAGLTDGSGQDGQERPTERGTRKQEEEGGADGGQVQPMR